MTLKRWALSLVAAAAAIAAVATFQIFEGKKATVSASHNDGRLDAKSVNTTDANPAVHPLRKLSESPIKEAEEKHWRELLAELTQKSEHGDLVAASRLYRATVVCEKANAVAREARGALDASLHWPSANQPYDDVGAKKTDHYLGRLANDLKDVPTSCLELTDEELDSSVYRILLQAANLGNADAAMCYAFAPYNADAATMSPSGIEDYRENALRLVRQQLQKGDWRSANLMAVAYSERRRHGLFGQLVDRDAKQQFAYLALLSLGAIGEYAEQIAAQIKAIIADGELSETDIAEGKSWAEDMYREYFGGSVTTGDEPFCGG